MSEETYIKQCLQQKDTIKTCARLFGCSTKELVDTIFFMGEEEFLSLIDKPDSVKVFKEYLDKVKSKC